MILAVDVGNSNIVVGLSDGLRFLAVERLGTERGATEIEYAVSIKRLLELKGLGGEALEDAILSSVVPSATGSLRGALRLLTGREPLVLAPGVRTGLDIRTDEPSAVGADRIADAVAAKTLYGAPVIIIDMGTANTVSVLDAHGRFLGGVIMPGLRLSAAALAEVTSQLPHIGLEPPGRVIGRSTVESLRSGLILGCAATLDNLIRRIEEELGYPCAAVATGGMCPLVLPHCRRAITHAPDLLLQGLMTIYKLNR